MNNAVVVHVRASKWRLLSYWATGLQPREYNNITIIICNCSLFSFFLFDAAKPFQQLVICRVLVVARRQMLQLVRVRKYAAMCVCPLFVVIVFDLANWHLWLTVLHPGSISLPRSVRDLFSLKWLLACIHQRFLFLLSLKRERQSKLPQQAMCIRPLQKELWEQMQYLLYTTCLLIHWNWRRQTGKCGCTQGFGVNVRCLLSGFSHFTTI